VLDENPKKKVSYIVHGLVLQSPSKCIYEAKRR